MRKKLHQFAESRVDQVILLNQAGKTTHKAICDSLELFAKEVMPEFHALRAAHQQWKDDVLAGRIVLENLATDGYDIYAHQEPGQQREHAGSAEAAHGGKGQGEGARRSNRTLPKA